jgi:NADH:ubiquinone oxidoreductase subunit
VGEDRFGNKYYENLEEELGAFGQSRREDVLKD